MGALKRLPFLRNRPKEKDKMKAFYRRSMCKTLWQFSFFSMATLASVTNFSLTSPWTALYFSSSFAMCKSCYGTRSWSFFFLPPPLPPLFFFKLWHWILYICAAVHTHVATRSRAHAYNLFSAVWLHIFVYIDVYIHMAPCVYKFTVHCVNGNSFKWHVS